MGRKKKSTSTKGSNKKGNNTKTHSNKDLIQDVKKKINRQMNI